MEVPAGATKRERARKPKVDLDAGIAGARDALLPQAGEAACGKVNAFAGAFAVSTPSFPTRSTALFTVTYPGAGGEVSYDLTGFAITVHDRNDLESPTGQF